MYVRPVGVAHASWQQERLDARSVRPVGLGEDSGGHNRNQSSHDSNDRQGHEHRAGAAPTLRVALPDFRAPAGELADVRHQAILPKAPSPLDPFAEVQPCAVTVLRVEDPARRLRLHDVE